MLFDSDTIAAISTPLAPGGLGVIRISGPDAIKIADAVFAPISGKPLAAHKGYTSAFGHIIDDGQRLDECVAAVFRAPRSYTGEDTPRGKCTPPMAVWSPNLKIREKPINLILQLLPLCIPV